MIAGTGGRFRRVGHARLALGRLRGEGMTALRDNPALVDAILDVALDVQQGRIEVYTATDRILDAVERHQQTEGVTVSGEAMESVVGPVGAFISDEIMQTLKAGGTPPRCGVCAFHHPGKPCGSDCPCDTSGVDPEGQDLDGG